MKAIHRIVATGAFGGLAAATVAGSLAFACTPQAAVKITDPNGISIGGVIPGQTFQVQVSVSPSLGDRNVRLMWQDLSAVQSPLAEAAGPSFNVPMTIPMGTPNGEYNVVAFLTEPISGDFTVESAKVVVNDPNAKTTGSTDPEVPVVTPEATAPVAQVPTQTPAVVAPTTTPAPSTLAVAPVASKAVTQPAVVASVARAAVSAPVAQAAISAPLAAATVPVASGPIVRTDVQLIAPSDLWSGLSAERSASLVDTSAPASQNSAFPAGLVLMGAGIVALAGVALAAGRRQLAFRRQ